MGSNISQQERAGITYALMNRGTAQVHLTKDGESWGTAVFSIGEPWPGEIHIGIFIRRSVKPSRAGCISIVRTAPSGTLHAERIARELACLVEGVAFDYDRVAPSRDSQIV